MKKIIFASVIMLFSIIALPALAVVGTFKDLVNKILIDGLLRPLPMLLVGLAVIIFIYGVIILIFSEGGEKKEEGKQYMIWGIVGIFVMVSVWGLVNILIDTFNLNNSTPGTSMNVVIPKGGNVDTNFPAYPNNEPETAQQALDRIDGRNQPASNPGFPPSLPAGASPGPVDTNYPLEPESALDDPTRLPDAAY